MVNKVLIDNSGILWNIKVSAKCSYQQPLKGGELMISEEALAKVKAHLDSVFALCTATEAKEYLIKYASFKYLNEISDWWSEAKQRLERKIVVAEMEREFEEKMRKREEKKAQLGIAESKELREARKKEDLARTSSKNCTFKQYDFEACNACQSKCLLWLDFFGDDDDYDAQDPWD